MEKKFKQLLAGGLILGGLVAAYPASQYFNQEEPVLAQEEGEDELVVNAYVEIPTGSSNKYEYDEEVGGIILDRVLYSPLYYPTEYGYIPDTLGGDGDPLDVLVLTTHPTAPGVTIEVRVIGMLGTIDGGEEDHKLLAVPNVDPRFDDIRTLDDVEQHTLDEIGHFFDVYKDLEGTEVELLDWEGTDVAEQTLREAIDNFNNQ